MGTVRRSAQKRADTTNHNTAVQRAAVLALFKFGQRRHMEELICEGHVFMRPLSDFVQLESDELRGDKDEALTRFDAAADGGRLDVQMNGQWAAVGTILGGLRYAHPATQ